MPNSELRLAEPLAALSVATDLARGRPPEQALAACIIATRLADYLGFSARDRANTYFATLLRFAGCVATSHEFATELGGDDVAVRFNGDSIDPANGAELSRFLENVGKSSMSPSDAMGVIARALQSDCEVGRLMAVRLGLEKEVSDSIYFSFERWDGHGIPANVPGPEIPLPARTGGVAHTAAMFAQAQGRDAAVTTLKRWAGSILDPEIAACFLDHADELLDCVEVRDVWQAALAAEPMPFRTIQADSLDDICRALGDFIDLKTPFLLGHSARVAALAEGAAGVLGLSEDDCVSLRRAALLHDLGRAGIASGIWEKPAPLSSLEMEQARLHPYHTERILERSAVLRPFARLAGQHHERIDGSGYFRGLPAASQDRLSRILAAADACAELLEDRPGREALSPDAAAKELSGQALDPDALAAVLQVAGVRQPDRKRLRPAGLTDREVEVLGLLARGHSLSQIADQLVISPSTAHTHAAHVYEKAGISTRAAAALFAMEHGLIT